MDTLGTEMVAPGAGPKPSHECRPEEGYARFEAFVRARVAAGCGPLLSATADADDLTRKVMEGALWASYLGNLPPDRRAHYDCRACEHFIRRYGGLVVVHDDGSTSSVLWSPASDEYDQLPEFFRHSVEAMCRFVEARPVCGVFLDAATVWGTPHTGTWTHLCGEPGEKSVFAVSALESVTQAVAARREGFGMVIRALIEFPAAVAAQALEVLALEAVPNGEKALGVAKWFAGLHEAVQRADGYRSRAVRRTNLVWRAVAMSPPAFHHVSSTMIGTLMADLKAGKPMAEVRRAWVAKMDPGRYMRPQAAPTAGQVDAANKVAEKLGISPAHLARRFVRLAEIPAQARLWSPPVQHTPKSFGGGGTFDSVRPVVEPPAPATNLPETVMTWEKFARTVLGEALEVRFLTPESPASFYGLLTATDPAAPPLLQWDGLEGLPRNPVSWYVERTGSYAVRWGLGNHTRWVKVNAVLSPPYRWNDRPGLFSHHEDRAFLVLDGAKDSVPPSLCLFPTLLRSEFHGVRAVIEKYSNDRRATGATDGDANGFVLRKGDARAVLWVRTPHTFGVYHIDRWD